MAKKLISLFLVFCLLFMPNTYVISEENIFTKVEGQLEGVTDEEKEVLEALFLMEQELEQMELEQKELVKIIDGVSLDIQSVQEDIREEELRLNKNKDILGQVLQSYQKMGSGSFLEMILMSENLGMFIKRINTFRDFSYNTKVLLKDIDANKERLLTQQNKLAQKLEELESQKNILDISIKRKQSLIDEKELFLSNLKEKRNHYESVLNEINSAWSELLLFFNEATKASANLIDDENLTMDILDISFSLRGVKISLKEEIFNEILVSQPYLEDMKFTFDKDVITLDIPTKQLSLKGNFILQGEQTLIYKVIAGTFYGLPLENNKLDELFIESDFIVNLGPVMDRNKIKDVKSLDGLIELIVELRLF